MKNILKDNWNKKTQLLAHHLRPAASALLLGIAASLLHTLLRMGFTQVIRYTVDGVLLGDMSGLPAFLHALDPASMLAMACVIAALISLLEFGAGYLQVTKIDIVIGNNSAHIG